MAKVVRKVKKNIKEFRSEILKQMLALATSGFGFVAALSWNDLIKELISQYIQPLVGQNSGIISLLIFAILVTFLAVFITFSLTKLVRKN